MLIEEHNLQTTNQVSKQDPLTRIDYNKGPVRKQRLGDNKANTEQTQ